MEADFSGYATKSGLRCTDGRIIMPNAFEHQDKVQIPLVWQHGHQDSTNILGHAVLENRSDGVYAYGYFNESPSGKNAKVLVEHGDIDSMSIWANNLVEKVKQVFHGSIKEVSLVLSGANPGAKIDFINLQHDDGSSNQLDDEAIIFTGLTIEHSSGPVNIPEVDLKTEPKENSEGDPEDKPEGETVEHAEAETSDKTIKDVYDTLSDEQKDVVYFMVGEALESAGTAGHSDTTTEGTLNHQEGSIMTNAFEDNTVVAERPTLSHDDMGKIMTEAKTLGSLKEAFVQHAGEYGIDDIDVLFPDAKSVSNTPEVIGRRTEWVADVLAKTKHSPFSRIKSTAVDLTADEARAKGYVKGAMKKDEIIKLLKRVTTPTTIYKKQKLDRDDIVDITEIDVVVWLKAEMRVMLDEELARAILVGDSREPDDEDKVDEDHLRPIAYDSDMYSHSVNLETNNTPSQTIEAVVRARRYYKGTGVPTMYTTDDVLTDMILDKDTLGRRFYNTEAELAAALRVDKIVTVEPMEDAVDVVAIVVNLSDYTIGADKGGEVNMFDDFDIDYNQQKYLIETRISGALTKPKSALVFKQNPGTVVTPEQPAYDPSTKVITIPAQTGVVYKIDGITQPAGDLAPITETTDVESEPTSGYSFPHGTDADWVFVY